MHLQLDSRPGIPDVSADGLALAFVATAGLDVVATLTATLPGVEHARCAAVVEVLAASHRVHLLVGGTTVATEQVACGAPGASTPLPATAVHAAGDHELRFRSERHDLGAEALAALAARLRGADDRRALVVSFPGHPDALTSARVLADGWETWHLYPGARPHGVRTRTRVERR